MTNGHVISMPLKNNQARTDPELLHDAPRHTHTGYLDEVYAAKNLILCCSLPKEDQL